MSNEISQVRKTIDELDQQIVRLLNQRAESVLELKKVKTSTGVPAYVPEREQEVIDRVVRTPGLKIGAPVLKAIYREIIGACRGLQASDKIALLGEKYGWVHDAALRQLGQTTPVSAFEHPRDVMKALVQGQATMGYFPLTGDLPDIRLLLEELLAQSYHLVAETRVRRLFSLASRGTADKNSLTQILVTREFFHLVRDWTATISYPVKIVICRSVEEVVESLMEVSPVAGLVPSVVAKALDLNILQSEIRAPEELPFRCLTLRQEQNAHVGKGQKATVLFALPQDPNALAEVLDLVGKAGLQTFSVQTFSFGEKPWKDLFMLDFGAAATADAHAKLLKKMEPKTLFLKNLGVYPIAE